MDRAEAQALVARQLDEYRARSYSDLANLIGTSSRVELAGPSGQAYQCQELRLG